MPKINQEEYEILKELDDKWKWIVRNDEWQLEVRKDKPFKKGHVWSKEVTNHGFSNDINNDLFHFIQWNDINGHEEPYNIAELIEEHEFENVLSDKEQFEQWYHGTESEETEVKKNIEWMKREIKGYAYANYGNRLKIDISEEELDSLINLLVSKQELPVIPKFVADYLPLVKEDIELEKASYYAVTNNELPKWKKEYDWIRDNFETFVRAWLAYPNIEVEEEQKYVIKLDNESYLQRYEIDNKNIVTPFRIVGHLKEVAIKFDNKERAEKVAELVEGKVEELEE